MRIPHVPKLATQEGASGIYELLRDLVPVILGPGPTPFQFALPPANFSFSAGTAQTRMVNRERSLSVIAAPGAVIVENSAYVCFEDFLEVIRRALTAAAETAPIAGMQRIGIRYIDEIRVPGIERPADWTEYINGSLLCVTGLSERFPPQRTEGLAEFYVADGRLTVMRFGVMTGRVVEQEGHPLRLRQTDDGPFFLIDLDSFWTAAEEKMPEFDVEEVIGIVKLLRDPVRTLFEASVTDRLRNEVFRKEVAQ